MLSAEKGERKVGEIIMKKKEEKKRTNFFFFPLHQTLLDSLF